MAAALKRIGLLLASIHTGASLKVWPRFAQLALKEGVNLFIFPGGRLNAQPDGEYLRNGVYALANQANLDGLISWSSAIGYTESPQEFAHFHQRFDPLPYVTLAYKIPGHPCVEFDAYQGMKALVTHFIRSHGARKIAFLRGPASHQSALARFQGYADALKAGALDFKPRLVSEPCNWDQGPAAAASLFEKQGLIPGRDFDTLIGSSDLMVFGAIQYLAHKGYHIPSDYHAGGFNNSGESRLLPCPLSTVHMPYTELSAESFAILLKLLKHKQPSRIEDVLLKADLIIRESCGCTPHALYAAGLSQGITGNPALDPSQEICSLVRERLQLPPRAFKVLVLPVVHSLLYEATDAFLYRLKKALGWFFTSGRDVELLVRLFEEIVASGMLPQGKTIPALAYGTLFQMQEQKALHTQYQKEQWNTILNSLKCELLGTRDRGSLMRSLARYLPEIGITTGAIVLYEDEKISLWVGSFSPQGLDALGEQRFPSSLLLPRELTRHYCQGVFMVQPLFIENQSLGYFIHQVPLYDGVLLEELRSAVSYALKGISLLDEVIRAKQIAEQAEQAKTALLQVLEHEIYDPLAQVMEGLDQVEKELPPIPASGPALTALQGLKALVAAREAEGDRVIERTLSRINELSLRKTLFDIEELLPGIGVFPLLTGDVSRLSQCFSLIREEYPGTFTGKLHHGGLVLSFSRGPCAGAAQGKSHGLLLAERIVRLHGGEFYRDEAQCRLLLPWTSLSGREALRQPASPQGQVLALSDPSLRPANFFDLPVVQDIEQAAAFPGRTTCIFWNTDGASAEDLVRVASLRHRREFFGLPFLCYGKGLSWGRALFDEPVRPEPLKAHESILDAIEGRIKGPRQARILMVGLSADLAQAWAELAEGIRIRSMALFYETVTEMSPSLIALEGIDPGAADAIRRHPVTVMVPLVMVSDRIERPGDVLNLCHYARLLICNTMAARSPEFIRRLKTLLTEDEILPPYTGALVKKALLYVNRHAASHISRWKLAESVHVSEDYLTRIFHREMGLSLWDYLNRYRVFLARERLLRTHESIQEIALCSGFQNQAYFCRVFKKIYGISPGQLRKPGATLQGRSLQDRSLQGPP